MAENCCNLGDDCVYGARVYDGGFLVYALVSFPTFLVGDAEGG